MSKNCRHIISTPVEVVKLIFAVL